MSEKNQEVRRIMIERYGVGKYLVETEATVLDSDFRGTPGGGARALMEDKNKIKWLVATDGSTDRVYHMMVDISAETCKEAHESLCGFDESLIKIEG